MFRLRRTLCFAVPLTCAVLLLLIRGEKPAAAATRSPLLAQRNASSAIAFSSLPPGSLPIPLMTDPVLRARLKTDSVFAAQVRDHDAHYASGANIQPILRALHPTAPAQLNADYVYLFTSLHRLERYKTVQAVMRSQLGSIRALSVVPMSVLSAISDIYWLRLQAAMAQTDGSQLDDTTIYRGLSSNSETLTSAKRHNRRTFRSDRIRRTQAHFAQRLRAVLAELRG